MRHHVIQVLLCLLLAFPLFSTNAQVVEQDTPGKIVNDGMLKQVTRTFLGSAQKWQEVLSKAASYLFWTLGFISVVWTGVTIIFRKGDFGEFLAEFVKFTIFFGFFLWLLTNGPNFAFDILVSLQKLGQMASQSPREVSPDVIVILAYNLFVKTVSGFSATSPILSLFSGLMAVAIVFLLVSVAINFLLLTVSGYLVLYAGLFILGFGGSRWTSDIAINYYKTILGIAIQLLTCILLVGVGADMLDSYSNRLIDSSLSYSDLCVMLIFSLVLLQLTTKIPPMVAGMINSATGGQQIGGASAAGVAAATAAYAGTAMAAAMQTAGAGSAVSAAIKSAMAAQASSGGDVVGRMRESASLANAFPGRSSAGEAGASRGGSFNASARPSSVDQAAGRSASDSSKVSLSDGSPQSGSGLSASGAGEDSASSSQGGASSAPSDEQAPQASGQGSDSSPSSSPASLAAQPSFSPQDTQDGLSTSSGGDNGSKATESSAPNPQISQQEPSNSSKPLAQNMSASAVSAKPWEVADGEVPKQDISQTGVPAEPQQSPTASVNSGQAHKDEPAGKERGRGGHASLETPVRPSAAGRVTRVAMAAAGHLATGAMTSFKKDLEKKTVGGRIAASITAERERREEVEKRGRENRNIIASAGPDFHAEVQELLNMNQK